MNFRELCDVSFQPDLKSKKFVSEFLNPLEKKRKYIMGMAKEGGGLDIMKLINIDGFIDDFTELKYFQDKPIVKTKSLSRDSLIVVCSSVRTYTAIERLRKDGFYDILDFPTFFLICKYVFTSENMPFINDYAIHKNFSAFKEEFKNNSMRFEKIYNRLADQTSKNTFHKLIEYRITANVELLKGFCFDPSGQYFPNFLSLNNEVLVDIGGYDGATSIEFIKRDPNYKRIWFFEPSLKNIKIAKEKLSNCANINFLQMGVSNKFDKLFFSDDGSSSNFSGDGEYSVTIDSLDNLIKDKVSFIKMDIYEDGESKAIQGFKNHILNDYPIMALVVYHKPNEFWQIPETVLNIRDDYDLYMRHYTEGVYETVMYFIPRY